MITGTIDFAVCDGMNGIDRLAKFLNATPRGGDWHFATGTRFDQKRMSIVFDDPADSEPALRRYHDAGLDRPPLN
ncbi:hypothetical protein [Magnetospirillum molischianum]|uniref:Uncharacterized protein n=1 Tax=Magnetospirillum molischianum DSM 120 TaxID=1150626 RepID=H8FVL0_MAGML|nr:hypothetical protein [Magnetospirillum molischianum]CCG42398.1 hypothetical protein PHAMO_380066 [Magnetospirillum molischianum DSM 120]